MISSLKQNRCISETEQDRSKLLLITNRKSHTQIKNPELILKHGHCALCYISHMSFGVHQKLNKEAHTISSKNEAQQIMTL